MKKKIILITVIIFIILLTAIGIITYLCNPSNKQKEVKDAIITNKSDNFKKTKEYQNLILSNIKFELRNNESIIEGTLTNKSSEKIENIMLEVVLMDKQKNEKGSIYIYVDSIDGASDKIVSGSIDQNYIDAYDCHIRY